MENIILMGAIVAVIKAVTDADKKDYKTAMVVVLAGLLGAIAALAGVLPDMGALAGFLTGIAASGTVTVVKMLRPGQPTE